MKKDCEDGRQPGAKHDAYYPREPLIDPVFQRRSKRIEFSIDSVKASIDGVETQVDCSEALADLFVGTFEMGHTGF